MEHDEHIDPVIVASVLEKLQSVDGQLEQAERDVAAKQAALVQAESAAADLAGIRERLAAFLRQHGASVPNGSEPEPSFIALQANATATATVTARLSGVVSAKQAVEIAARLMAGGEYRKMQAIYDAICAEGHRIPVDDPIRRLTQAMSASKRFEADRSLGWRLKPPAEGAA